MDFISIRIAELLQETLDEMNNRNRAFIMTASQDEIHEMLQDVISMKMLNKQFM